MAMNIKTQKSSIEADECWLELANAIIFKAVEDYRNYPSKRLEVARFLKSDYCAILCQFDGQAILDGLEREVEEQKKREEKENV